MQTAFTLIRLGSAKALTLASDISGVPESIDPTDLRRVG